MSDETTMQTITRYKFWHNVLEGIILLAILYMCFHFGCFGKH